MAIDTAEKRRSIAAILNVSPGVTPESSKDIEWRVQVAYTYSGVFSESVTPDDVDPLVAYTKATNVGMFADETNSGYYATPTSSIELFVERG